MKEIEAILEEAKELKAEFDRIEAIPFPAVRRWSRRHFRPKLRRFLTSVEEASNGFAAAYQQRS